jgi:carbohydrate-selective porin OprB
MLNNSKLQWLMVVVTACTATSLATTEVVASEFEVVSGVHITNSTALPAQPTSSQATIPLDSTQTLENFAESPVQISEEIRLSEPLASEVPLESLSALGTRVQSDEIIEPPSLEEFRESQVFYEATALNLQPQQLPTNTEDLTLGEIAFNPPSPVHDTGSAVRYGVTEAIIIQNTTQAQSDFLFTEGIRVPSWTVTPPNLSVSAVSVEVSELGEWEFLTAELPYELNNQDFVLISQLDDSLEQAPAMSEAEAAEIQAQQLAILGALLSTLNGSPFVFGTLTTVVQDFSTNTQLTGNWGGARNALPQNGVFFDIYSTTTPQGIASGARNSRGILSSDGLSVLQNFDAYLNIVEPWPGAILHGAFQAKIGGTLTAAGTLSPTNYGSAFPVIDPGDYGLFTEYYLLQSLLPNLQITLGKSNGVNSIDLNAFANNYRYQFQNGALNNNLMLGAYAPPGAWTLGLAWQPASWLNIVTGIADPGSSPENFADNFFDDITVLQEFAFSYDIQGNPGHTRLGWLYTSLSDTDFSDPFNTFGDSGVIDFRDPLRTNDGGYMFYLNFDQYLFTIEPQLNDVGLPQPYTGSPRGLGLFGRLGIGPEASNFIRGFASLGIGAKGIISGREYDQFGLGFYYADVANGIVDAIQSAPLLSRIIRDIGDESGMEAYYNLALTPALQVSFNLQYIFDAAFSSESPLILGGRVQLSF